MEFVNGFRMTSHIYISIYEMENKIPWFQTTNKLSLFDVKSIASENGHGIMAKSNPLQEK